MSTSGCLSRLKAMLEGSNGATVKYYNKLCLTQLIRVDSHQIITEV